MRLAILGASGHGKVVAEAAELSGWQEVVFYDDAWPGLSRNGPWDVVGSSDSLLRNLGTFEGVVVAIGNNRVRAARQAELVSQGAQIATVVHPSAVVSPHALLGSGTVVFANAVVNPCASIGPGCIVNTGAVVEHDCEVGEFSHLSPNAVLAGGAVVGRLVWLGACACVRQLVSLGDEVTVGMGSAVLRDVPAGQTVVGSPARAI